MRIAGRETGRARFLFNFRREQFIPENRREGLLNHAAEFNGMKALLPLFGDGAGFSVSRSESYGGAGWRVGSGFEQGCRASFDEQFSG